MSFVGNILLAFFFGTISLIICCLMLLAWEAVFGLTHPFMKLSVMAPVLSSMITTWVIQNTD